MYASDLGIVDHEIVLRQPADGDFRSLWRQGEEREGFVLKALDVSPPDALALDSGHFDADLRMLLQDGLEVRLTQAPELSIGRRDDPGRALLSGN